MNLEGDSSARDPGACQRALLGEVQGDAQGPQALPQLRRSGHGHVSSNCGHSNATLSNNASPIFHEHLSTLSPGHQPPMMGHQPPTPTTHSQLQAVRVVGCDGGPSFPQAALHDRAPVCSAGVQQLQHLVLTQRPAGFYEVNLLLGWRPQPTQPGPVTQEGFVGSPMRGRCGAQITVVTEMALGAGACSCWVARQQNVLQDAGLAELFEVCRGPAGCGSRLSRLAVEKYVFLTRATACHACGRPLGTP